MLSWQLTNAVAALLLPPGVLLLVLAAGFAALRSHPRSGRFLLLTGGAGLYLLSLPWTGSVLLQWWETPPDVHSRKVSAGAIVVLGAGRYLNAPEYGGRDTVGAMGLVRLRYAAELQRRSGLPVLVSGGSPDGGSTTEAQTMREVLEREFSVPVRWSEGQSLNTLGNARHSRDLLAGSGIRRILLVTHAWHMPRARLAFESVGLDVLPAPTGHATRGTLRIADFLPDAGALLDSALVFHEILGVVWYRLRLFFQG